MKSRFSKVAEIQLVYRNKKKPEEQLKISSSKDAYDIFLSEWDDRTLDCQEQFKVALLNNSNRVLGILPLSTGGVTGTVVDVRLLFAAACKSLATSIILAHNHPSGTLTPSDADKAITRKCKQAGELHDIKVLDHLIVTRHAFRSFSDDGIL